MSFPEHLAELESRLRARFEATVDELRAQYEARLREASEQMLSSVASLRPAADPLAGVDLSGLELAAPGPDRASAFGDLIEAARALDRAGSQAEAL
ncbi:MAG TPA: hypothetical protein VLA66_03905, partial [Thermoanaerobaculia bacterium]|nr:hypothetical protein [Thermoanaerobaculia bacterium]